MASIYMIRERGWAKTARYTNFVLLGFKFANPPRLSTTKLRSQWGHIWSFFPGAQRGLSPPLVSLSTVFTRLQAGPRIEACLDYRPGKN